MAKRAFTWVERICEALHERVHVMLERPGKYQPPGYPGGLGMMPVYFHAIVPRCALVAGPGAPEHLAADRARLRAHAARSRRERPAQTVTVFMVGMALVCLAFMVGVLLVGTFGGDRGPDLATMIVMGVFLLFFLGAAGHSIAMSLGRHVCLVRAMQDWSERLGGDSAIDTVEPVVGWMEHYWPWLSPPHFLAKESVWATGRIQGFPVLLISEREDSWMIVATRDALVESLAQGEATGIETPASALCRFSLFVSGALLRKDAAAQAVIDELGFLGYGVVTCPAGVYVYGLAHERSLQPRYFAPVLDKTLTMLTRPSAVAARAAQEG